MKKKAKRASKNPLKSAKPLAVKRARPAQPKPAAATRDELGAGLEQLVIIAADMRELLAEIRDLLAEGAEEAEEGGTVVVAESEGEGFE